MQRSLQRHGIFSKGFFFWGKIDRSSDIYQCGQLQLLLDYIEFVGQEEETKKKKKDNHAVVPKKVDFVLN